MAFPNLDKNPRNPTGTNPASHNWITTIAIVAASLLVAFFVVSWVMPTSVPTNTTGTSASPPATKTTPPTKTP